MKELGVKSHAEPRACPLATPPRGLPAREAGSGRGWASVLQEDRAEGAGGCSTHLGQLEDLTVLHPVAQPGGERADVIDRGGGAQGRGGALPSRVPLGGQDRTLQAAREDEGHTQVDPSWRWDVGERSPGCTHSLFTPLTAVHVVTWGSKIKRQR